MAYTITDSDLDWLERQGHRVDRVPVALPDGREYYHIDGLPRDGEQIVRYIVEGLPMGD